MLSGPTRNTIIAKDPVLAFSAGAGAGLRRTCWEGFTPDLEPGRKRNETLPQELRPFSSDCRGRSSAPGILPNPAYLDQADSCRGAGPGAEFTENHLAALMMGVFTDCRGKGANFSPKLRIGALTSYPGHAIATLEKSDATFLQALDTPPFTFGLKAISLEQLKATTLQGADNISAEGQRAAKAYGVLHLWALGFYGRLLGSARAAGCGRTRTGPRSPKGTTSSFLR